MEQHSDRTRLTKRGDPLALPGDLQLLDGFPFFTTMFGIGLHVVYYQFLKTFPFVDFSSPMFLGACGGLLVNHWCV